MNLVLAIISLSKWLRFKIFSPLLSFHIVYSKAKPKWYLGRWWPCLEWGDHGGCWLRAVIFQNCDLTLSGACQGCLVWGFRCVRCTKVWGDLLLNERVEMEGFNQHQWQTEHWTGEFLGVGCVGLEVEVGDGVAHGGVFRALVCGLPLQRRIVHFNKKESANAAKKVM